MNKYKKGDILIGIKEHNGQGHIRIIEILKVYKEPRGICEEEYLARDLCDNFVLTMNDERFEMWGMLKTTIDAFPEYTEKNPLNYTIREDVGQILKKHFCKPAQREFKKDLKKKGVKWKSN